MCGCSAHWIAGARCTCTCTEHEGIRIDQARTAALVLLARVVLALGMLAFVIYWLVR